MATLTDQMQRLTEELTTSHKERTAFVESLAHELREFLGDWRAQFRAAARADRDERAAFMDNVQQSCHDLLQTFRENLASMREDIEGASHAWQGFAAAMGNGHLRRAGTDSQLRAGKPHRRWSGPGPRSRPHSSRRSNNRTRQHAAP